MGCLVKNSCTISENDYNHTVTTKNGDFIMSNVNRVMDLIVANPNLAKADLINKIVEMLNVSKSNAQVYVYNAKKKLDKGDMPKERNVKVISAKVAKERAMEEVREKNDADIAKIKADRLEVMKKVGAKMKREKQEAEQIEAEMAAFSGEGEEYTQTLSPEFLRRELGIE